MKSIDVVLGQRELDSYNGVSPSFDYLNASLIGLKKVFARRMSLYLSSPEKIFWSTTADWKSTLLLRKKVEPPFIRLAIRSVSLDTTRINLRAMARSGVFSRHLRGNGIGDDLSDATLDEIKFFPITVNYAGYWVGRDAAQSLKAGIWLTVLSQATGGLSFVLDTGDVSPYEVAVRTDTPEWSVPGEEQFVDLETEGQEELQTFSFNLQMNTLFTINKQTPSVRQALVEVMVSGETHQNTDQPPPTSDQRRGQVED